MGFFGLRSSCTVRGSNPERTFKVGYERVAVNGNTVVFADDLVSIDLGAIAKGYIADRMKEYLKEQGVESAIINLGAMSFVWGNGPEISHLKSVFKSPLQSGPRQWRLWISVICL